MRKNQRKSELLVRVIAPNLSDIGEFYKRLQKISCEVYPTGQKRSEFEQSWRGYFIVVLGNEDERRR